MERNPTSACATTQAQSQEKLKIQERNQEKKTSEIAENKTADAHANA